jgi:hypothetical protein
MADRLIRVHGFSETCFAAPLKEAARIAFDFSGEQLYGSEKETEDKRYKFTGICPHCHQRCLDTKHLQGEGAWQCLRCRDTYTEYVTPRLALQTLGTEWGRTLYDNIWVDACFSHMNRIGPHKNWVISDLRFHNEMAAVVKHNGFTVRLKRNEQRYAHASEAQMAEMPDGDFNVVIDNNGTLDEFGTEIDAALRLLRER